MAEATLLELDGQLTDWLELGEDLPKVRLTYVPSAIWAQLISRQEALMEAIRSMREALPEADDPEPLLDKIQSYSRRAHLVTVQLVGLSLREIEGHEPLRIGEDGGVDPEQLEVIWGCGWAEALMGVIVKLHKVDRETWRSLLRGRLG